LSTEEFFDYTKGTFHDNMFVVAVSSGLRPGNEEALGKIVYSEKEPKFIVKTSQSL